MITQTTLTSWRNVSVIADPILKIIIFQVDDDLWFTLKPSDALALGKALTAAANNARPKAKPKARKTPKRKRAVAKQATVSHLRVVK